MRGYDTLAVTLIKGDSSIVGYSRGASVDGMASALLVNATSRQLLPKRRAGLPSHPL